MFIRGHSWLKPLLIALAMVDLTSCATVSRHEFAQATGDWQTRSGQLMYRNGTTIIIGDVVVGFSGQNDFQLAFSKGPGITLLSLREDAGFAEITGPLARRGWSGPIAQAPAQLRGWLELRDKIVRAVSSQSTGKQNRSLVRHTSGAETFILRF